MPEALKGALDAEAMAKDPKMQAFLKDAHAKGMSQTQLDFTVQAWAERVADMVGGATERKAADCVAELRKQDGWKSDGEYLAQVQKAYAAGKAYGGPDFDGILKDYGNDARIVRLLANVGKEMGADGNSPHNGGTLPDSDVDALMKSPAYLNKNDPQHAIVSAKVKAHFDTKHGTGPAKGGAIVMSTA